MCHYWSLKYALWNITIWAWSLAAFTQGENFKSIRRESTRPRDSAECNFDQISEFFCFCLNCVCSIDLNNSSFEFSFISLTDGPIIITGHEFIVMTNSSERETERGREGEKKRKLSTSISDDFQNGRTDWKDPCLHKVLLLPITSGPPWKATFDHARREKSTYHITNEDPDHLHYWKAQNHFVHFDEIFKKSWLWSFWRRLDLSPPQTPDCITIIHGVVRSHRHIMTTDLWVMHRDNSQRFGQFFPPCMLRKHIM